MGDTEMELSPAHQQEALQKSPSASSLSLSTASSLSLPSSPSSGPQSPASPSISTSTSDGPPLTSSSSPSLDVITEGVGELTVVIDPEMAKLACQEVLQKVKFQKGELEVGLPQAAADTDMPTLANGAAIHIRD